MQILPYTTQAILFLILLFSHHVYAQENLLKNPSFELETTEWENVSVGNYEYFAPVDSISYAISSGGAVYTSQTINHTIAAGEIYSLTVWVRSIYSDSHVISLLNDAPENYPPGNPAKTTAEIRFYYGSTTITSKDQDINPLALKGAPQSFSNDDGGNVMLDQNYRMAFAEHVFYQLQSADPILDPWTRQIDHDYDHDMAVSPIITPQGLKALYSSFGNEFEQESRIKYNPFSGSPPDYNWGGINPVVEHEGSEVPWVIDPHLYYDSEEGRLWMSWGGLPLYISELDPGDGRLIDHPANIEFDSHPAGYHTVAARWSGDEWTDDHEWAEGPALFKHNGYWYFFASYGNLGLDYTIRMGRGAGPSGPFYDKDGVGLTEWNISEQEYGNSLLLGDESDQLVPGHPHIWEENGKFYLGYDYRTEKDGAEEWDILGIRRLYWVNDWPTIWTPITLTFNADDYPDAIGQQLGVSFRNIGEAESIMAVDSLTLKISTASGLGQSKNINPPITYKLYQNYPNPFNPETTITFQIPSSTHVVLDVFNHLGEKVVRLLEGEKQNGLHNVTFNAANLTSGVYYYRLQTGTFTQTKKCLLIK